MNHKQLLALFGLKWNPFSAEVPDEALVATPAIEHFIWRVEGLVQDGGFALVTGEPGLGKSVCLRLLARKLSTIRDLRVAEFSRPQNNIGDFYRELGALFGIALQYHNRWRTFHQLREQWVAHIEKSLTRPVLIIDEAQEMNAYVLSELRLLSSMHFDSKIVLTVIIAGDQRLNDKLRSPELIPLGSRIRARLNLEPHSKEQLLELLTQSLARAGAPKLMTKELVATVVEHAAGNPRVMNIIAGEILSLGIKKEVSVLDESLYLETLPAARKRAS
jgi:type II secretory pathway predicted ATPase ExeA